MHDTANTPLHHNAPHEEALTGLPHLQGEHVKRAAATPLKAQPRGLLQRLLSFIGRLFAGKHKVTTMPTLNATERAAASRAAQMQPPVAFRGDTTSTLATPMSAYAGKPVEQAIRKRAEQQFLTMDTSTTTMN